MRKSIYLLSLFALGCTSLETQRYPAAISSGEVSCLKLHQAIIRRHNDLFEVHHFRHLSDIPEGLQEVANVMDELGIDYHFIRKTDDDKVGLEILPNDSSRINRYVKNIHKRFDEVRVFYLDVPESRTLGSFTPSKNYIYLGKKVITNINGAGFTTLSHEARHAYFSARIFRYMDGAYKGQVLASKGTVHGSQDRFGYTSYMSFQEIKTFREDSRQVLKLWQDDLYTQRINNAEHWKKFNHKINAAKNFLNTTEAYLDHLMDAILEDTVEFNHRLGVLNAAKEVHHDTENVVSVSVALSKHVEREQLLDLSIRMKLKEDAIKQINRELDQIYVDKTILESQLVFKEELEEFTEYGKAVFFSKFAYKNSLVNARELRPSKLQDLVAQHYETVFRELVDGQKISDDSAALASFAELVRQSHITNHMSGYQLNFRDGRFKLLIDDQGSIQRVLLGP